MDSVKEVRAWFEEHVRDSKNNPYMLDDEQARAVIDSHKNTLVSARAGAGKTHTLVAKIIYQIAVLGYSPNQILAFVFNKKAALEINDRLSRITVDGAVIVGDDAEIARTFHSFSLNTVKSVDGSWSFGDILLDDDKNADTKSSRSLYIQAIIERLQKSDRFVAETIYNFFRKESSKIDKELYESPEAYYDAVRNHGFRTLDGLAVNSFSEKIIADFFFEHGVEYRYEPEYYPRNFAQKGLVEQKYANLINQKDTIKGDFLLSKEKILWEHWAIRGNESDQEIKQINESGAIEDYQTYKETMRWKRFFYSKVWRNSTPAPSDMWYNRGFTKLIETHRPIECSREEFEQKLENTCKQYGIALTYHSKEDLIAKAWKKQVKYFTTMITSFIDRTQQMYFDDIDLLEAKIANELEDTEDNIRTKRFHQIGIKVYKEYLLKLSQRQNNGLTYINDKNEEKHFTSYGTDFSMLLQRSRQLLHSGRANYRLRSRGDVKLILVDEYQDFSRLFYENLVGVRLVFPRAKLFCVGDDWQAINRFAGSDDTYFSNFQSHFSEDSNQLLISNNYRSAPEIVKNANRVMGQLIGASEAGFARPYSTSYGRAIIKSIDLSLYDPKSDPEQRSGDTDLQKYIEMVGELIIKHRYDSRVLVLHRKKDMLYNFKVWGVLRHRVRDYVTSERRAMTKPQFDEKIRFSGEENDVMTVHKSKGLEADTVILLEADPKVFPSESNNINLFSLFGDSYETARNDEARLFYVAITRPKTNLYVLWGTYTHKPDNIPEYISALRETRPPHSTAKQLVYR
jgi:DNA helicase-4